MIFKSKKWSKGKYSMPDRDNEEISSSEKDKKPYNMDVANYVYHEFCRGGSYITYDWYDSTQTNRDYSLGLQSESIYREAFYGKEVENGLVDKLENQNTRNSKRKAFANLNFTIQSPAPRLMDSIVNKVSELVERVSVDAIDPYSGAVKEGLKWGTYVDGKFRKEFESLNALMALPQQELGYTPRSVEELNLYEAEGGFKVAYADVMEQLVKHSFDVSHFTEVSLEKYISDLVTLGFAVGEDYHDKESGLDKTRYVDAQYAGVQYTTEESYMNPDYGFYVKMVKLSDLRKKGFDTEKLMSTASKFRGYFGNENFDDWNAVNKRNANEYHRGLDNYVVPVFVVKWIDVEHIKEKEYKNRQGKTRTKRYKDGEKPRKNDKVLSTRIKTVRQVHWVIDTDICYDFGKAEHQCRDGLSEPVLPIHMVKVNGRPIIPRLIPSLDQYMNAWMRLQQGISMAAMNGYAINMDAVSNLSLGGKKLSPIDVMKIWRQTGTLFFKPTDMAGRPNAGMISKPIEQLAGGAGSVIAESVQMMDVALKQMEELTGINPVSMGATPTPEQGKAVTEYALMGTNDILKSVLKQANILKSNMARSLCLRLQYDVSNNEKSEKAYEDVVGKSRLKLLKIADGHDVKYGIRTHARPTKQEIAELKDMISLSLKNGRDGKVGITEADYVRFNSMINSGASLKRVALLLDFANKKAQEEAEARAQQAQMLDQQGAQQLNAQKAEQEAQKIVLETQSNVAVENVKGRNSILEKAVDSGQIGYQEAMAIMGVQAPPQQQQAPPQQQQAPPQQSDRLIPAGEEGA